MGDASNCSTNEIGTRSQPILTQPLLLPLPVLENTGKLIAAPTSLSTVLEQVQYFEIIREKETQGQGSFWSWSRSTVLEITAGGILTIDAAAPGDDEQGTSEPERCVQLRCVVRKKLRVPGCDLSFEPVTVQDGAGQQVLAISLQASEPECCCCAFLPPVAASGSSDGQDKDLNSYIAEVRSPEGAGGVPFCSIELQPSGRCKFQLPTWSSADQQHHLSAERFRNPFKGFDYFFKLHDIGGGGLAGRGPRRFDQIIAEMKCKPCVCTLELIDGLDWKVKGSLLGFMIAKVLTDRGGDSTAAGAGAAAMNYKNKRQKF